MTETTTAPQMCPDTTIGAATREVTPSVVSSRWSGTGTPGSSVARRAGLPVRATSASAPTIETTVPAPGICTPGSLHLPTITPSDSDLKRTRFAASAPRRRATSSVTTSKTRSDDVSVATVTATRFSAACSSTSMRRSSSCWSAGAAAWEWSSMSGPEGVERLLVERLGADIDPATVLDADQQRLLDVE